MLWPDMCQYRSRLDPEPRSGPISRRGPRAWAMPRQVSGPYCVMGCNFGGRKIPGACRVFGASFQSSQGQTRASDVPFDSAL